MATFFYTIRLGLQPQSQRDHLHRTLENFGSTICTAHCAKCACTIRCVNVFTAVSILFTAYMCVYARHARTHHTHHKHTHTHTRTHAPGFRPCERSPCKAHGEVLISPTSPRRSSTRMDPPARTPWGIPVACGRPSQDGYVTRLSSRTVFCDCRHLFCRPIASFESLPTMFMQKAAGENWPAFPPSGPQSAPG